MADRGYNPELHRIRRVCYFGTYSADYTRNRVNIIGLKQCGVEVLECRSVRRGLWKYADLFVRHWRVWGKYDALIVGFHGPLLVPLAWMLTRFPRRPLIFDAFTSLYDSLVLDRRVHPPRSVHALWYKLIDSISYILPDLVLFDCAAHVQFIQELYPNIPTSMRGLPVGCPDDVMYPRSEPADHPTFRVHFHGTNIPTQGIPYILEAAKLLADDDVRITLIGRLSTSTELMMRAKKLGLTNVIFLDRMPYTELAARMAEADLCLGAFGDTEKARHTGAFKIIEAMAMRKPVLTGESPALREFFTDNENILFCALADAADLAAKIRLLKSDRAFRNRIAEHGYRLYTERFTPVAIGESLLQQMQSLGIASR